MGKGISRKDFIRNSALGMTGLAMGSLKNTRSANAEVLERPNWKERFSANDRINIATIGMGIISIFDTETALEVPGVEMVAAADCYDARLARSKEIYGDDIFTTKDYREILERDDVDAVLICTPDHWHTQIAVDAMNAGKDVYCEKPMVHKIGEGQRIIDAQRKTGRVLQVGAQFASDIVFLKAQELYRAGAIGTLNQVVAIYNRNSALGAWQYSMPEDANPQTIDWDTFLGDAPEVPWDPKRFFRWRCYNDYGTGIPGDLFVHLFTGVHTVTGAIGPTRIAAAGGIRSFHDGREAPDVISGQYSYPETDAHPDFTMTLQGNLADGSGGGSRFQFIGDEGVIEVSPGESIRLTYAPRRTPSLEYLMNGYNSIITVSEDVQKEFEENYTEALADQVPYAPDMDRSEEFTAPDGYDNRLDHFVNFFDSIRNGTPVFEDAVFGFRAAAPSLLTNVSQQEERMVRWNPESMRPA